MAENKVSFYKGPLKKYGELSNSNKEGAIYFANEGVIMLDDQEYVRYNPSDSIKEETIKTTVGGIKEGTAVSDLQGKSFSALFDAILFPVKGPVVAQTNSITWGFKDQKVLLGSVVQLPTKAAYNPGKWLNGDDTEGSYTGESTIKYSYNINGVSYNSGPNTDNSLPEVGNIIYSVLASNTFTVNVDYEAGDIPKDGNGKEVEGQISGGKMSITRKVDVSVPYYTSTKNQDKETEGKLIDDVHKATTTVNITVPEGSSTLPQWFSIPGTVTNAEQESTTSGKYENINHLIDNDRGWKGQPESIDFNGIEVPYTKYIWNGGARKAVNLKITFNRSK